MIRSDRPTWDHQFAETESERNARLRAKRLTMNETNEHNHTTQDEQPVTITAERYRQYQDAEAERDQLRNEIAALKAQYCPNMSDMMITPEALDELLDRPEVQREIKLLADIHQLRVDLAKTQAELEAARAYARHERDLGADECALADAQTTQALRDDLAEAVEALKPFAQLANTKINPRYDPAFISAAFTFEDCAHARAIVEKHKEPKL